ncbi:peptidase [Acidiplasma sp. MBA-1]|jgi:membrane-associated protease RseP (regulator of RpoE activity)|nr:peptidase [Acidiplasma sp. MBA-1]
MKVQNERLQGVVATVKEHINYYEAVVNPVSIKFYFFDSDNPDFDRQFDELRKKIVPEGFIPFVVKDAEHYVEVSIRPDEKYKSNNVNVILLILTLASTIYVGSIYARSFVRPGTYAELYSLWYGFIFFSLPLMLILGIHETAHYVVARRYKVNASLPFFIPFPYEIGTFGAFVSLRDPMPNRKAMAEIGAAGPIAGFLVALPLLFLAQYLEKIYRPVGHYIPFILNYPLIYRLFGIVEPINKPLFPMVFAVWVGMFATALNLIPTGQLDGGHIARGILGKKAYIVSYLFLGFLFYLTIAYDYLGWLFLALFVIFMGLVHPPALNDYEKIRPLDIAIGIFSLVMFILTFTALPIKPP